VGAEGSEKASRARQADRSSGQGGQPEIGLDCEPRELAETWVRWSNDGGRTWRALTVGQKGNSVIIDPEQLPSGELTFQLLPTTGSTR
jgi:hypothetical protein